MYIAYKKIKERHEKKQQSRQQPPSGDSHTSQDESLSTPNEQLLVIDKYSMLIVDLRRAIINTFALTSCKKGPKRQTKMWAHLMKRQTAKHIIPSSWLHHLSFSFLPLLSRLFPFSWFPIVLQPADEQSFEQSLVSE